MTRTLTFMREGSNHAAQLYTGLLLGVIRVSLFRLENIPKCFHNNTSCYDLYDNEIRYYLF